MIKDYNKCITVINATTGDILEVIKMKNHGYSTIQNMITDFIYNDFIDNQYGILIKYGIEP